MGVTIIEMCAYPVSHVTGEFAWRCVVCDEITKHEESTIFEHLVKDHGLDKSLLKKDKSDGIFLYPASFFANPGFPL